MDAYMTVRNVWKHFAAVTALRGVSFSMERGEFLTLLGPSGCGKTTLLRCIAGFERLDAGEILIEGRDVTSVPPERRDIGFVFQNYALFPTMTVAENVRFGLEMRKVPATEIAHRLANVLSLVGLVGMVDRKPRQLSGGQQQRVALARAMVIQPRILLFDEPLSNLDAKLRVEMRTEIRQLQRRLGLSAVYVTHDQEEAFSLSDRVVVMSHGEVQQVGTPQELYYRPGNIFVAEFIGQTNLLPCHSRGQADGCLLVEWEGTLLRVSGAGATAFPMGEGVMLLIRPERMAISSKPPTLNGIRGTIEQSEFLGGSVLFRVDTGGRSLVVRRAGIPRQAAEELPAPGREVFLSFDPGDAVVLKA
jgi:ABC-type Fe3+/spermidine/putrescine transport system ATPase subunit